MSDVRQIFVRLVDEVVDVWRPVEARHCFDNVYRILDQPYDRDLEAWEFGPGDVVVCKLADLSGGQVLAATGLHETTQSPHP